MKTWQEEGFDSPEQQICVHSLRRKNRLQHGDYCEVTEEQAIELLTIEGDLINPRSYVRPVFNTSLIIHSVYKEDIGIVLSGFPNGDEMNKIDFSDFRARLINTMQTA